MKKLIIPMMFILSIPIVFAMYGGETIKIFDEDYINLTINVTVIPYQDKDEFKLSSCELLNYSNTTSIFNCNCSTIYFNPAINSVGNYTFDILYFYQEEEEDSGSSGSRGGSSKRITFKPVINVSKPEKPTNYCGDGNCDWDESCRNCARDCGECEISDLIIIYCEDGDLRCADGTLLICENGDWEIEDICECIDGECVKKIPLSLMVGILLIVLVTILLIYRFIIKR